MQIKFKKLHPDAVAPKQGTPGSAGFDLTVCRPVEQISPAHIRCWSGVAVEIPKGYVGLIFPRSSICKKGLLLTNSVGVIDSDYRGEISAVFDILHSEENHNAREFFGVLMPPRYKIYEVGDRFAQLVIVPIPDVEYIEVEELSATERGAGGYGSTGK